MTPSIKLCSGAEAVKKFRRAGWTVDRQKGSHMMMVKANYQYTLSIPLQRELGMGILKKLIRQAGLSVDNLLCRVDPLPRRGEGIMDSHFHGNSIYQGIGKYTYHANGKYTYRRDGKSA